MTEQRHIGRYRVLEEIASGGQATVYLVWDPQTSQAVALKVMHRHLANNPSYIDRFQREASMAASLSHPNIIHILEVGQEDDNHFIAMEYLPRSVYSVLRSEGSLPLERAIAIARQVALALEAAHEHGIVHRDIKPHNILLTANDTVKVADFGIARGSDYGTLTATGMMMGTPQYMSPEQCDGQRADIRSDLYALGIVLYEMLSGEVPFKSDTFFGLLREVRESQPRPIKELRPDVPDGLAGVVARCLEKDPALRYQTPQELAGALTTVTLPQPVATVQVSPLAAELVAGGEGRITVVLRDASGRVLADREVTWSSDNPAVATVSSTGLVRGVSAGATQVTATSEGKWGTVSLTVTVPAVQTGAETVVVGVDPQSPTVVVPDQAAGPQTSATTPPGQAMATQGPRGQVPPASGRPAPPGAGTPGGLIQDRSVELAGTWRRVGALLIDYVLLWIVNTAINFVLGVVFGGVAGSVISLLVNIGSFGGYFIYFWTTSGQTLGKKALGIKVVRTDGSLMTRGKAALRALLYYLSSFLLGLPLLWAIFDSNKQGVHDKIADTHVIRVQHEATE